MLLSVIASFCCILLPGTQSSFSPSEELVLLSFVKMRKPHVIIIATDTKPSFKQFPPPFYMYKWVPSNFIHNLSSEVRRSKEYYTTTMIIWKMDQMKNRHITKEAWTLTKNYIYVVFDSNDAELRKIPLVIGYDTEFYLIRKTGPSDFNIYEQFRGPQLEETSLFGTWSAHTGLVASSDDLDTRRSKTRVTLGVKKAEGNRTTIVRCLAEIWDGLAAMSNFSSIDSSNSSSIDAFLNMAKSTHEDAEVVGMESSDVGNRFEPKRELIGPIHQMKVYMHVKSNEVEVGGWQQFLKPLSGNAWVALGFCLVIASVVNAIVHLGVNSKTICAPLSIFCNQDDDSDVNYMSVRMASLSTRMSAMIVLPLYSAFLLALITVSKDKMPFNSMKEFLQTDGYTIAGINGSYTAVYLNTKFLDREKITEHMPVTRAEALKRLCSNEKLVYLEYHNILLKVPENCRVLRIPEVITTTATAIELASDSPFTHVLNKNLLKFYSSGILKRMSHNLEIDPTDQEDGHEANAKTDGRAVHLFHVLCPFYILFIGGVSALLIMLVEIFWKILNFRYQLRRVSSPGSEFYKW